MTDTGTGTPLLELQGIVKRFGGVLALDDVSLSLDRGQVLGLVGDNGAGKSTLIKVVAGAYQPDAGTLRMDGAGVRFPAPRSAKEAGIETVYQDLALVDTLDAAGNIFLGRELVRFGGGPVKVLNKRRMQESARELLGRLALELPSSGTEVGMLSGGQRQSVAISRALYTRPKLVILDEPTSALAVTEARKVLELPRTLAAQGVAVIIISHTLQDVLDVTDRIAVLRKGRKVADLRTAETTLEELVAHIVGGGRTRGAGYA
ncbi:MAG TPA: ATP-binding cassette domain-containing protein [Trueperaceae bacterium]|nr:ATP-binding cassette domain-containing protein [Trueperaceae bacterium]